jgi:hypothetical protein
LDTEIARLSAWREQEAERGNRYHILAESRLAQAEHQAAEIDDLKTQLAARDEQIKALTARLAVAREPAPPMTLERACEVLNQHKYDMSCGWIPHPGSFGALASRQPGHAIPASQAIAIAENLIRDSTPEAEPRPVFTAGISADGGILEAKSELPLTEIAKRFAVIEEIMTGHSRQLQRIKEAFDEDH